MCKFELKSPLVRRVLGLGGVGSGWRQTFTICVSVARSSNVQRLQLYHSYLGESIKCVAVTCSAHAHACNGNTPSVTPMQIFAPNPSPSRPQVARVDLVSTGLSTLTFVSDGCTYIDSQSIQVSFSFDSTSDLIVGLDPTTSKTRHVLYPNPSIWTVFFCMLRHTLTYSLPPSFLQT